MAIQKIYKTNRLAYSLPRPKIDHTNAGDLFFFATKSFREVGKIARDILPRIHPNPRSKFTYAFEMVLFNLCCSALYKDIYGLEVPVAMSMRNGSRWSKELGYRNLKRIVTWFEDEGYITIIRGWRSAGRTDGVSTKLQATDKLVSLVQEHILEPVKSTTDLVGVKDAEEDWDSCFGLVEHTTNILGKLNDLISKSTIKVTKVVDTHSPEELVRHLVSTKGSKNIPRNSTTREVELISDVVAYSRIFSGKIGQGGRLISGIQQLPRPERYSLTIDDKPTVEVDFKSMHPSICYALLDIQGPEDNYAIQSVGRDTAKIILLSMLNASNRSSVVKSIRWEAIKNGTPLTAQEILNVQNAVSELEEIHAPLSEWFYSSAWKQLQFLESQIMLKVMEHFVNKGVVCLGVHDSAIVPSEYEEELKHVMLKSFREVLDTTISIVIETQAKSLQETGIENVREIGKLEIVQ